MADWSELQKDLLGLIVKRQDTSFDVFRFRQVCSRWRSSVAPKHRGILSNALRLSKRTVFLIRSPQNRGQTNSIRTSWLIQVEEDASNRKKLLNPLKRQRFDFTKVFEVQNLSILEIGHIYVLNCPPNNEYKEKLILMHSDQESDIDRFVLLTIHVSRKLATYKSEQKKWTILEHMPSRYDDVILHKGQFYAVDNTGRTYLVDHVSCNTILVANHVPRGGGKKYLVECKGDLLLVDANVGSNFLTMRELQCSRRGMFKVFRLNGERKEWFEMKNLGNYVLFLGEDCVFSASTDDLCVSKGNCIVYVDNRFDVRVFDLESGCVKPLGRDPELSKLFWPPPSWFTSTRLEDII